MFNSKKYSQFVDIYNHESLLNILAEGSIFTLDYNNLNKLLFPKELGIYSGNKPKPESSQWESFITKLFTSIRDNIYGLVISEQYVQFYNGLIRKLRDEKKLGDHNQCYQANKHKLRLATIDRSKYSPNLY